jgi:hypothetical protein
LPCSGLVTLVAPIRDQSAAVVEHAEAETQVAPLCQPHRKRWTLACSRRPRPGQASFAARGAAHSSCLPSLSSRHRTPHSRPASLTRPRRAQHRLARRTDEQESLGRHSRSCRASARASSDFRPVSGYASLRHERARSRPSIGTGAAWRSAADTGGGRRYQRGRAYVCRDEACAAQARPALPSIAAASRAAAGLLRAGAGLCQSCSQHSWNSHSSYVQQRASSCGVPRRSCTRMCR